jgi:hypothetical protein
VYPPGLLDSMASVKPPVSIFQIENRMRRESLPIANSHRNKITENQRERVTTRIESSRIQERETLSKHDETETSYTNDQKEDI